MTDTMHRSRRAHQPVVRRPYVLLGNNPNPTSGFTQKTGRTADLTEWESHVTDFSFHESHKDFIGLGTIGAIWRYEPDTCPAPKPWGCITTIMAFHDDPFSYDHHDDVWYANGVLYRLPENEWVRGEDLHGRVEPGKPLPAPTDGWSYTHVQGRHRDHRPQPGAHRSPASCRARGMDGCACPDAADLVRAWFHCGPSTRTLMCPTRVPEWPRRHVSAGQGRLVDLIYDI